MRGEDGGEFAQFRAGFQAAPFEIIQFAIAGGFFDVTEAKLLPDVGSGVGKDRIEGRGDNSYRFGGCRKESTSSFALEWVFRLR